MKPRKIHHVKCVYVEGHGYICVPECLFRDTPEEAKLAQDEWYEQEISRAGRDMLIAKLTYFLSPILLFVVIHHVNVWWLARKHQHDHHAAQVTHR